MSEKWQRRHSNGWECSVTLVQELHDGNTYEAYAWPDDHNGKPTLGTGHPTVALAQAAADDCVWTNSEHGERQCRSDSDCTPWSRVDDSSN